MKGREATVVCNGCGLESSDRCWWACAHIGTSTNTGISYGVLIQDQDYCPNCWKRMVGVFKKEVVG